MDLIETNYFICLPNAIALSVQWQDSRLDNPKYVRGLVKSLIF